MASKSSARTNELKHLIETRKARIGIVGMGYVGLPLALLFSEERFPVTGFDIDARKVEKLNQGDSYIVRIPGEPDSEGAGERIHVPPQITAQIARNGCRHHVRADSA